MSNITVFLGILLLSFDHLSAGVISSKASGVSPISSQAIAEDMDAQGCADTPHAYLADDHHDDHDRHDDNRWDHHNHDRYDDDDDGWGWFGSDEENHHDHDEDRGDHEHNHEQHRH